MAEFKCEVVEIEIEEHPSADLLELAVIGGGIRCIVRKDQYKTGDHVIYIPEASIVPDDILEELGLTGKLSGKAKNRVKPVRLRGVLSDGLIMPLREKMNLGDDVTEILGVKKYVPEVPSSMSGEVHAVAGATYKYDFSNLYRVPDIFNDVDHVVVSEKLHGTFCGISIMPDNTIHVWSKGLGGDRGLVFKNNEKNMVKNVYMQTLFPDYTERILEVRKAFPEAESKVVRIFGEVFGKVQDLTYGIDGKSFRAFDIMVGNEYVDWAVMYDVLKEVNIPMVPFLYTGAFDIDEIDKLAYGTTTLNADHIREGIVIRAIEEQRHEEHGRCIAKIVSDDYKGRKGGSELN